MRAKRDQRRRRCWPERRASGCSRSSTSSGAPNGSDRISGSYADAALRGSSYLKLPRPLRFITGNIGLHHVHHLSARIPNYNLQRAHDENPIFHGVPTLSLWDGMRAVRLKLWTSRPGSSSPSLSRAPRELQTSTGLRPASCARRRNGGYERPRSSLARLPGGGFERRSSAVILLMTSVPFLTCSRIPRSFSSRFRCSRCQCVSGGISVNGTPSAGKASTPVRELDKACLWVCHGSPFRRRRRLSWARTLRVAALARSGRPSGPRRHTLARLPATTVRLASFGAKRSPRGVAARARDRRRRRCGPSGRVHAHGTPVLV